MSETVATLPTDESERVRRSHRGSAAVENPLGEPTEYAGRHSPAFFGRDYSPLPPIDAFPVTEERVIRDEDTVDGEIVEDRDNRPWYKRWFGNVGPAVGGYMAGSRLGRDDDTVYSAEYQDDAKRRGRKWALGIALGLGALWLVLWAQRNGHDLNDILGQPVFGDSDVDVLDANLPDGTDVGAIGVVDGTNAAKHHDLIDRLDGTENNGDYVAAGEGTDDDGAMDVPAPEVEPETDVTPYIDPNLDGVRPPEIVPDNDVVIDETVVIPDAARNDTIASGDGITHTLRDFDIAVDGVQDGNGDTYYSLYQELEAEGLITDANFQGVDLYLMGDGDYGYASTGRVALSNELIANLDVLNHHATT